MKQIFTHLDQTEYTLAGGEGASYAALLEQFFLVKRERRMVYFIGNGGSAGIATHMSADFLKNGGMRTHSMLEPTTLTCLGNDFGYAFVFSRQLEIIADEGDLLVAISSSGNSPNIVNATQVAREKGCRIVTFTGFKGDNKLRGMGDINVYIPCMEYGPVESIHNMILQQLVDDIVARDGMGMK